MYIWYYKHLYVKQYLRIKIVELLKSCIVLVLLKIELLKVALFGITKNRMIKSCIVLVWLKIVELLKVALFWYY
jgi:hypothetical protein